MRGRDSVEAESTRIQLVAPCRIVRWILCSGSGQSIQCGLVYASSLIHGLSLSFTQRRLHRGGAGCIWTISVIDNTLTQTRQRNSSALRSGGGVVTGFITVENEQFVFFDRASESAAKCVTDQRCTRNPSGIAEPIVGLEKSTSVELKPCPMPTVRARLGDKADLGTG